MPDTKGKEKDFYLFKRLIAYLNPYKFAFTLLLIMTMTYSSVSVLIPSIIQKLIDEHLRIRDYEGIDKLFYLMMGILFFQGMLIFGNTYLSSWIGQSVVKDIRVKLYAHIIKLRLKFYDNTPIGQLVTRCVSDVQTLADVFSHSNVFT